MPRVLHKNLRQVASRTVSLTLNHIGEEREVKPVSLPRLSFAAEPSPDDSAFKAEQLIKIRVVRAGRDAWEAMDKAETFDGWKNIGAALAVGREFALKRTGANAPMGRAYSKLFGEWIIEHGFDSLPKTSRSWALALHENFGAIVAWRGTLSDRERNRLRSAQGNVRRWQASTGYIPRKCSDDLRVRATALWWRFVRAISAVPENERLGLWNELFSLTSWRGQ